MKILYFCDTNNKFFQIDKFRKPFVGKDYKNEDIIIAGCSFAQGACLYDDETISAVIAKKFPKYKVYNIGLCGGSQRETLYILRNSQKFKDWNILPSEFYTEKIKRLVIFILQRNSKRN